MVERKRIELIAPGGTRFFVSLESPVRDIDSGGNRRGIGYERGLCGHPLRYGLQDESARPWFVR